MCGIIGYFGPGKNIRATIGNADVSDATTPSVLLEGLRRLEYRGYDSSGIGLRGYEGIRVVKAAGKVADLEHKVKTAGLDEIYQIGIAHTRWATHGEPTEVNAHPHTNQAGTIAVVHNGIIENNRFLRNSLGNEGYSFSSDTDSEVIPHMIDYFYRQSKDFKEAVRATLTKLEGAYAFLAMHKDHDKLIAAKLGSPLCLGVGDNTFTFGSDESPFVDRTRKVVYIDDGEMVAVDGNGYTITNFEGFDVLKEISDAPYDLKAIGKCGYEHFMLKEIHEQPETVRSAIASRIDHLDSMRIDNFPDLPDDVGRIIFLACGTSLYAGMIGQYVVEKNARIPVQVECASEFRYRNPVLFEKDMVIAISQSGQTADTKEALKLAKDRGCYTAGIVNRVGSEIARLAGKGFYLHAGPEIGVASTKAFTSQVVAVNLLNLMFSNDEAYIQRVVDEMRVLPEKVRQAIEQSEENVMKIAAELKDSRNFLFLGRDVNYPVALEGALKLKEISYIPSEGQSAGEMKHGTIALIDGQMPSVFLLSGNNDVYIKTMSNIVEVKSRGGRAVVVTDNGDDLEDILTMKDHLIRVPPTIEELSPIINILPLQMLAYYIAKERGCAIDQPRNLAKSVTVE